VLALATAAAVVGVLAAGAVAAQQGGKRLQGQVSLEDQQSGRSQQPYVSRVHLVGRNDIMNRGMNGNLGWLDDCAYVSAYYGGHHPLAGLAVLDVSNPHKPELVRMFPGTPGTRESQVEANADSRMLVVMPFSSSTIFGDPPGPTELQIYDVPGDCRNPVRVGTFRFDYVTHEHFIWRHIVYATQNSATRPGNPPAISVIDASDKANPREITRWDLSDEPGMPHTAVHDLDISPDGRRAYVNLRTQDPPAGIGQGLMVLDTSEIAEGRANPVIRRISRLEVQRPPDRHTNTHSAQLVKIAGRPYVLLQDETFNTVGCPWGWARIVDVSDESSPIQISTFRLEVNMRRHCEKTRLDNAMYSAHYLGVDDPDDAKLAFFTWYSSGLRIVDISDPYAPKEVGYFVPGATTGTVFQDNVATRFGNNLVDYAYSFVRYHKGLIWFNSVYGGFHVVRFTGRAPE
jgi:hypothetical protein